MIALQVAQPPPVPTYGLGVDWVQLVRFLNPLDWLGIAVLLLMLIALAANDPALADDHIPTRFATYAVYVLLGVVGGCFLTLLRWANQI